MSMLLEKRAEQAAVKGKNFVESLRDDIEVLGKYFETTELDVGVEKAKEMKRAALVLRDGFDAMLREIRQ